MDELWLDESFATFAEILYVEETQGKERAWAEEMVWTVFQSPNPKLQIPKLLNILNVIHNLGAIMT